MDGFLQGPLGQGRSTPRLLRSLRVRIPSEVAVDGRRRKRHDTSEYKSVNGQVVSLHRDGRRRGPARLTISLSPSSSTSYSLKKYNLLRESSEGYSLLLVLLHSEENLGPGKDPSTGWDVESLSRSEPFASVVKIRR